MVTKTLHAPAGPRPSPATLRAALCGALCLVGAPGIVPAQAPAVFAGQSISIERAIALVERRFQARVVRAAVTGAASRPIYELKLLSEDGRVWTVRVDARTGEVR